MKVRPAMMGAMPEALALHHHSRRMDGRDPHERHRVATPLELLFDLTFVIAFGLAAARFAHAFAEGHYGTALAGFGFAGFAICWAWINFSWFASAYDTDDWIFRVVTMVQMIGVLILALGVPRMFASLEHGEHLDNSIMVLGYVVMRVAMIFQWLRAARQDPARRRACLTYVTTITVSQIGWVAVLFLPLPTSLLFLVMAPLFVIELLGPYFAERKAGGTPWHAHHIVERYSLFAIIGLGEALVGTVASLSAVVDAHGWTMDVALVGVAGVGLTFGMWWVYFMLPAAPVLHVQPYRSFVWGYGQIVTLVAIVATGAGLHIAAYFIDHESHIGPVPTVLSVAIPVGVFLLSVYLMYAYLLGVFDPLHIVLLTATASVIGAAIFAATAGVNMAVCLIVLMFAPMVTVVGYELFGHKHQTEALAKIGALSGHEAD